MQTFSNSIYPKSKEKWDNSVVVVISAVFETRSHVDYRMVFWSKTF